MATNPDKDISRLLDIMSKLRDPETGCPWDKEQTFASILPFTIEEVYEVADAIEGGNMEELCDELGDLLFQIVFYAQISSESGHFDFGDILSKVIDKITRRHPHVFGDQQTLTTEQQQVAWEQHKLNERRESGRDPGKYSSILEGISPGLSSFIRAVKLQIRAASVGFDWTETRCVLDKIAEEITEVEEVLQSGADRSRLTHEIGDLLLAVTNLARHVEIDPELALHLANNRFEQRFRQMELKVAQQGRKLNETTLEELEVLWQEVKLLEKKPS